MVTGSKEAKLSLCVAMAQQVSMCILLLLLAVTAVAADKLSEGPSQLTCPPDQYSYFLYWFTVPVPREFCKEFTMLMTVSIILVFDAILSMTLMLISS